MNRKNLYLMVFAVIICVPISQTQSLPVTNLISNGTFDTDVSGWNDFTGPVHETIDVHRGNGACRSYSYFEMNIHVYLFTKVAITPSTNRYYVEAYVKGTVANSMHFRMNWRDESDTPISTNYSNSMPLSTSTYQKYEYNAIAPINAYYVNIVIYADYSSGFYLLVDDVYLDIAPIITEQQNTLQIFILSSIGTLNLLIWRKNHFFNN